MNGSYISLEALARRFGEDPESLSRAQLERLSANGRYLLTEEEQRELTRRVR